MKIQEIPIEKINPNPLQPRELFSKESIKELANSIKENDLLQPIVVRKINSNYQIICGERRWRAFSHLKRKTIPSIVWDVKDDIDALEKSAIENLQREDLTSVERENVITELWNSGKYKTHRELAKKLGYDERSISQYLRVKKFRDEFTPSAGVSTKTIQQVIDERELPIETKIEVIKAVEKGELAPSRVREEVRLIKAEKEIKEKYKVEIPVGLKKANFVLDFSKRCADQYRYFEYCNKAPVEAWKQLFTHGQLRQMKNSATSLFEELSKFLELMEEVIG